MYIYFKSVWSVYGASTLNLRGNFSAVSFQDICVCVSSGNVPLQTLTFTATCQWMRMKSLRACSRIKCQIIMGNLMCFRQSSHWLFPTSIRGLWNTCAEPINGWRGGTNKLLRLQPAILILKRLIKLVDYWSGSSQNLVPLYYIYSNITANFIFILRLDSYINIIKLL